MVGHGPLGMRRIKRGRPGLAVEARVLGLGNLSMILGRAATAAKGRLGREWIRRSGLDVRVESASPALRVRSPSSLRLFGDLSTSISLPVSRCLFVGEPGCQPGTVGRRGLVGVEGAHEGDLGRSAKVPAAGWTCSWAVAAPAGPVRSSHNWSKKGSSWACG